MSSNRTEKIVVEDIDQRIAAGEAFLHHITFVKLPLPGSTYPGNLWPAVAFPSYDDLWSQLPPEDDVHRYMDRTVTKHPLAEGCDVAYLIGKGTVISFVRNNKRCGLSYLGIDDDEDHDDDYEEQSTFDFWEHANQMKGAKGHCASKEFQRAYQLAERRIDVAMSIESLRIESPRMIREDDEDITSSLPDDDGNATAAPSKDVQDNTSPHSPPGVELRAVLHQPSPNQNEKSSSGFMNFLGGFSKKLFHRTTETSVAKITPPPRCDTDTEHQVGSPPIEETDDTTTVFSDRADGSLYADDKSAAVVNPAADKIVDVIGGKRKRGRSRHRSRKQRNKSKAKKVVGGCRMIPSSMLSTSFSSYSVDNEPRECLLRAILPLLATHSDQEKNRVALSIRKNMPEEGDTSIGTANRGLSEHGLRLESVTEEYRMKGGIIYNLLQKKVASS